MSQQPIRSATPALPRRAGFVRRAWKRRGPVWSVRTIAAIALLAIGLTAALVFLVGDRPLFVETGLTLAIVAGALFVLMAVGLYVGARVRRRDVPGLEIAGVNLEQITRHGPDGLDGLSGIDGDDGCLGAVVAVLLGIVVAFLLVLLAWLLINVGIALYLVLTLALSWVLYRALRQVFRHGQTCKGRLAASLGYALAYTALYTGWLFALVYAADHVLRGRLGR